MDSIFESFTGLNYFPIRSHFPSHPQVCLGSDGQYHKCVSTLKGLQYPSHSYGFSDFPIIFPWDRCIMGYPGVYLLRLTVKLDGLARIFIASAAGFFSLCGRCAAYFLEYYLSTLHSYVEFPVPCTKYVFAPVGRSLGWPA